jgi:tetratricopeptide (TPR) repeat protein
MEPRDLYFHLLDIASPWTVKEVVVKEGAESVDVYLECSPTTLLPCPLCNSPCPVWGRSPSKAWRHLDSCGKKTILRAELPVVDCAEHGKQPTRIPWADADSPVTPGFEKWVGRLAEAFGDTKKAALFAGVDHILVRELFRRRAERSERAVTPACSPPPEDQLPLFGLNDMTLVNRAVRAFGNLELEQAVDLFRKHRRLYPKGYDVSSRLKAAEFLLEGMLDAPEEPGRRPAYLFRLWDSFEDYLKSEGADLDVFAAKAKGAYFKRVLEEVERAGLAGSTILPEDIPLGYVLLQAGRYDEAIRSLQDCIPMMPQSAALYGRLGDAYYLRGDPTVARQCYREACLIDPAAVDWRHIEDADLKQLKEDILLYYDFDAEPALEWLPSHARIEGLFQPRVVRLHDGLKEIVDDYLAVQKAWSKTPTPRLSAKLFCRGIVLWDNRESLKFIKKIDLVGVRKMMKQANPELFEEFLERIVEGKG